MLHQIIMSGPTRDRANLEYELASGGLAMHAVHGPPLAHGLPDFASAEAAKHSSTTDISFVECVGDLDTVASVAARFNWVIRVHSDITNGTYHG